MKYGAFQPSELDKEVILPGEWTDSCKCIYISNKKTTFFVYLTILGSRQTKPTFRPTSGDEAALERVAYSGCLRNRVKKH